jgi:putative transposase
VVRLQEGYRVSERRAVKVLAAHRSAIRYRPKRPAYDAPIRKRIEEIAAVRIRYGYRRIHILLQREGWRVNLKRVYRIYSLAGLNLRSKRLKRRRMASHCLARPDVMRPNDCWTMDFVSDALFNGKRFRP